MPSGDLRELAVLAARSAGGALEGAGERELRVVADLTGDLAHGGVASRSLHAASDMRQALNWRFALDALTRYLQHAMDNATRVYVHAPSSRQLHDTLAEAWQRP